ncbi:MAG: ethanolamine utilization protein EutJ [Chloroflexi bacterium]|nr:MAG: ethanolamine utilization protein EutJ [Chloroflexota bacterium]
MNPGINHILEQAATIFNHKPAVANYTGTVHVGVDLGTAYTVLAVLDEEKRPLAGRYQFAQIVRDGLVVDFIGAIQLLKQMKAEVEAELGFQLEHAATTYPPGVPLAEVKATQNVLIGAGLECSQFVDEPTGANALLNIADGAIVDIGGGTTGIAIVEQGEVIYTADEATGGTHFSLVVAGAMNVPFIEAEKIKKDATQARMVSSLVHPVMQKVGSIVARHIEKFNVGTIYLVGGTSSLLGIDEVIHEITGVKTITPSHPMFVTPLGVAMVDR